MDEFERAQQRYLKSVERRVRAGRPPPPTVAPVDGEVGDPNPMVPAAPQVKKENIAKRGKVKVQIRVYLSDEPIIYEIETNMRGALLTSQLNARYIGERLRHLFKEFG